jgi:2-methylcitrate dehydratase PrpD
MGATYEIAKFVVDKTFSDFSEKDIKATKDLILDAIGVMVGGANEKVSQIAIQYAKDSGGAPECGVLGGGFKTSFINAVLINGTSNHNRELESVGPYTGSNPMTNIPVALAAAEKFNLSGRAVIEGSIIGLEVQTKMGMSGPGSFDKGFSSIPLYGTFGAAATAGKMMKMSAEQLQHAFGIGICQVSGQQRQQGTMTHFLEAGIGCRNGVNAALLAKGGMTSDPDLIEGGRGFYDLFCSQGRGYNLDTVVRSLGDPFCVANPGIVVKVYGCCLFNHRGIDAVLDMIKKDNIRYENVEKVDAEIPPFVANMLARFPEPKNGEEAKFSLRQSLGATLIDGNVDLPYVRPFSDAGAVDPRYMEAREKVEVITREDWTGGRSVPWEMVITVTMKDGRKIIRVGEKDAMIKGGIENPLTTEELVERYKNSLNDFLSPDQIRRSIDLVFNLEKLDNISDLMNIITFGKSK